MKSLARRREPAREAILISSVETEMSPGSLPGLLAGRYRPSEAGINLENLARSAGVRIIHSGITSINPTTRTVKTSSGEVVLYNAASIARGPLPDASRVPGASRHATFVPSLAGAMALVPALERLAQAQAGILRLAIVGGQPESLEIALTLDSVMDRLAPARTVTTIISPATAPWTGPGLSSRLAKTALGRQGITAILGAEITEVGARGLQLSNGATISFDILVWAADEAPVYADGGTLRHGADGIPLVDRHLQAVDAPGLFMAGTVTINDGNPATIRLDPHESARVIADNLLAVLGGRSPRHRYRLRERATWTETGHGQALLHRGAFSLEGGWLLGIKDRMDRRLMRELGALPA